jgi:hypothetical protein
MSLISASVGRHVWLLEQLCPLVAFFLLLLSLYTLYYHQSSDKADLVPLRRKSCGLWEQATRVRNDRPQQPTNQALPNPRPGERSVATGHTASDREAEARDKSVSHRPATRSIFKIRPGARRVTKTEPWLAGGARRGACKCNQSPRRALAFASLVNVSNLVG